MKDSEKIFVDTSAFYALLDRSDKFHQPASILWPTLLDVRFDLVTSNYVVSETVKLLQEKIGFEAASLWYSDILEVLDVWWVDAAVHNRAYELWLNLGRRRLSLVDCVTFVAMHKERVEKAFCFKPHFVNQGFTLLPERSAT